MRYFIYILACSNGSYYTGYTTDIIRRYHEHTHGSEKCKYTRSFPPIAIAACWEIVAERAVVLKIEAGIKRLSRQRKLSLIATPGLISHISVPLDDVISCFVVPVATIGAIPST